MSVRDVSGLEGGLIMTRMRVRKLMMKLIMSADAHVAHKMKRSDFTSTVEEQH